jgi:hypothetical protein
MAQWDENNSGSKNGNPTFWRKICLMKRRKATQFVFSRLFMKKFHRYIFLIISVLVLIISFDASAQRYKKRPADTDSEESSDEIITEDTTAWQKIRKKLVFGGGAGASFGNYLSYIEVSPLVGYRITPKWQAGIGGTYIRAWGRGLYYGKTNVYGGRVYTQYDILEKVFLHGEYEVLNLDYYDINTNEIQRTTIGNPFVGGGYRSMIGARSSFNIMILYNLNWVQNKDRSPYPMPFVIRMNLSL